VNARNRFYRIFGIIYIILSSQTIASTENGLMNALTTPILDPLLTVPSIINDGKALPGDSLIPACPAPFDPSRPLMLIDAIDIALCNNPQVKAAWANIKVQAAALGESRAPFLPALVGSASRLKERTTYPDNRVDIPPQNLSNTQIYANLLWRLVDFGGRYANQKAANHLLEAALSENDAVMQKALQRVVSGYFDAQTAKTSWDARLKNEAITKQTLATALRKERLGAGAKTDTLQADTAASKATLERSRSYGTYQKSIAVLNSYLGIPSNTQLDLAVNPTGGDANLKKSLAEWIDSAQKEHPAIIAARSRMSAAQEKVAATRSEGLPSIDLTGNLFKNGRPNQGLSSINTQEVLVGFTLNVPIFDGFSRTYKIRGAQALAEQRQAELLDVELQITTEIVKAYADLVSSLDNLEASRRLLSSAQESLISIRKKFDIGAIDILDMLNAQSSLANATEERIRCLYEWQSAKLKLLAAAGLLGRSAAELHTTPHNLAN
jgi:outer membrane protein